MKTDTALRIGDLDVSVYQKLIDGLYDGVYFTDLDRRIVYWNESAERISGYPSSKVVGKRCQDNILVHIDEEGNSLCQTACPLTGTLKTGISTETTAYLHHSDGHRIPVSIKVSPIRGDDGRVVGAVEVFSDDSVNTQMAERVADLEHEAWVDHLTGVANRRFTEAKLGERISALNRYQWAFGMMFIDIDDFKEINDQRGHALGDKALITVARTLEACVRPFDLVGRWGGDEFAALVMNVSEDDLVETGERLRSLVAGSTIRSDGVEIPITVSIGATMGRKDDTIDEVVKRADSLMYTSKKLGGDSLTIEHDD